MLRSLTRVAARPLYARTSRVTQIVQTRTSVLQTPTYNILCRHFFGSASTNNGATENKANGGAAANNATAGASGVEGEKAEVDVNKLVEEKVKKAVQEVTAKLNEEKAKEIAAVNDKMLRALAELENVRLRARQDVEKAHQFAVTNFAKSLLEVADNFGLALANVKEEDRQTNAALQSLFEALEMTQKTLSKVLEKEGIKKIDCLGQKFDPNLHMGLFEYPDPAKTPGTVGQIVKEGYTIKERILRAAQVGTIKKQ